MLWFRKRSATKSYTINPTMKNRDAIPGIRRSVKPQHHPIAKRLLVLRFVLRWRRITDCKNNLQS